MKIGELKKVEREDFDILKTLLQDLLKLELKTRDYHWNGRGPGFLPLHRELDSLYHDVSGFVDDVAERLRAKHEVVDVDIQYNFQPNPVKTDDICFTLGRLCLDVGYEAQDFGVRLEELKDAPSQDLLNAISLKLFEWAWLLENNYES